MVTRDEVARQPLEQRRARLALTPDELAAGIHGQPEAVLARRPRPTSWAATEIICHLRDTEEMFLLRVEAIAAVDEPLIVAAGMGARMLNLKPDGEPAAPERWARDRQYLRSDPAEALTAFRRLREGTLAHLTALSPEQWHRGGTHPRRGRLTSRTSSATWPGTTTSTAPAPTRARWNRVIEEFRARSIGRGRRSCGIVP